MVYLTPERLSSIFRQTTKRAADWKPTALKNHGFRLWCLPMVCVYVQYGLFYLTSPWIDFLKKKPPKKLKKKK
jgi:hypothetical protein